MAEKILNITKLVHRTDTSANWEQINPTLEAGEIGYDFTLKQIKIGDGSTPWKQLKYYPEEFIPEWALQPEPPKSTLVSFVRWQ